MTSIYVLGNPLLEEDALPIKLLPHLIQAFPNITFVELDPTEEFPEEEHLILIDTIINIKEITVITNPDPGQLASSPNYSLHDFDFAFSLKLAKKMGTVKDVTIIGVPLNINKDRVLEELKKIIAEMKADT